MFTNLFTITSTGIASQLSSFIAVNFDGFFDGLLENFHFIRPWWLLAFVGLSIVIFMLKKLRYYQSPWQHFLPKHLATALLENAQSPSSKTKKTRHSSGNLSSKLYWLKPTIISTCCILALAGPAWQKLPQPVYQLERGAVIIMDMSYSMYATDVKPNRLTRARYKAIDLLKKINEGDVGLIAYAGDAFIISPLTQDDNNIALLLPSLSPDIMPVHGANAYAALALADSTLKNSGHISGDIYWFTDDIDNEEMSDIFDWAKGNSHTVNILGVGTKAGAPITLSSGELLKDNSGAIVIPKLPEAKLSSFARSTGGAYHTLTNSDADIVALTKHLSTELHDSVNSQASKTENDQKTKEAMQGDLYQEQGPWLLLILLPFVLGYFRRGSSILAISWLMPLGLVLTLTSISPSSYAQSNPPSNVQSYADAPTSTQANNGTPEVSGVKQLWQDLWQTPDQQAQKAYQQKNYDKAAQQFENSQWQGSAHYKAGDYEKALESFKQNNSAEGLYNQGNSLAQLQKIDEAIEAYKEALIKDPNLTDAKENLATLEALKKQQEQQSQDGENGEKNDEQDSSDSQNDQQGDNNDQSQSDQEQSQEKSQDSQSQSENEQSQSEQDAQNSEQDSSQEKSEEEKEAEAKQAQKEKDDKEPTDEEQKSLAQQAKESKEKETSQKHQQLLNKVTDDPYLLLRNKMRLEYQKRRNEGRPEGVNKAW